MKLCKRSFQIISWICAVAMIMAIRFQQNGILLFLHMLQFNFRGLLTPDMNIPASPDDFEKEFVLNIQTEERKGLFENYKRYSESLKELCSGENILQWINGSFVTKKPNPGDLDMVSFIDIDILTNIEKDIAPYKYPNSYQNFGVDAYIMAVYPDNHPLYWMYVSDRAYWMDLFTKTKRNRVGTKWPKGFLEINY